MEGRDTTQHKEHRTLGKYSHSWQEFTQGQRWEPGVRILKSLSKVFLLPYR